MAMHTEPGLRFPAWLAASLAGVGVALGLWQVGAFHRPIARASGEAGQAIARPLNPTVGAVAVDPENSNATADGSVTAAPITGIEPLASDADPEVGAESAALLEALAAEQARDP